MHLRFFKLLTIVVFLLMVNVPANASLLNVDVRSLTLPAQSLGQLSLGTIDANPDLTLLPFYLQVFVPTSNNTNWGIELYTNNLDVLGNTQSVSGNYRGLRNESDINNSLPLYWQVYDDDQRVWDTPTSVTTTAGGLGFYPTTLNNWGEILDISDGDQQANWENDRYQRLIATRHHLGMRPASHRVLNDMPVFVYFGSDLTNVINFTNYKSRITLDLFHFGPLPGRDGYATPNPVKPVHGDRVYFNFYTNNPSSGITIKVFDPTGYPVRTIKDDRYWDCRNDSGHLVEGGLYLYQIAVEGRVISGTVVVIK